MSISNERKAILEEFQRKYDLNFSNLELLNQAFIHTSYTNELNLDPMLSYEKLEFYGDAVLKLVVSDFLYNEFPNYTEGNLTKLRAEVVSDKNIFNYALSLGFEELIILGKNEKKQGGAKKESILACAFEALLGAIFIEYREFGYKKAYDFLKANFYFDIVSIEKNLKNLNPKAILQEYTQGINHKLPEYKIIKEEGRAHDKTFFVEVVFNNEVIGFGCAKSIKNAQQEAAKNAIENLKIEVQKWQ